MPNRLAAEQSPYLLQHKDNPVDWYPWGDEAFARAKDEQKPIFLSVGYSTCHWCHVMEHESFENADVANVLNREFVSIKVDREERPDVDRVYMAFVQATTGSGGWPMSVWLTPTLEPFYGGTYFPPSSRWGRPGFVEILQEIARVWRDDPEKVRRSAASTVERLRGYGEQETRADRPRPDVLDSALQEFVSSFDESRGGFGAAPKFPRPSELLFLFREHARTGAAGPRDMALATLRAMALGGMRDHLGGGFHRYSVDADWRVPHFEKMLYDQAQLALAFVEAATLTGEAFYAEVAADTLGYVERDLTDAAGGFYSAEDADSVPPEQHGAVGAHKSEGAFYIWREEEIRDALGADADLFKWRYGVLPDGNAPFDPQGEFTHRNLLYTARTLEEVSSKSGRQLADVEDAIERARRTLLARRAARPRPHLDDKILTSWNGLMIAGCARASRMLPGGTRHLTAAQRAAAFIRSQLWDEASSTLTHRYRQGHAAVPGYAEDYAFLIFGLLELFQADGDPAWLEWALVLQRRQDQLFWDDAGGGWFSTSGADASILLRLKEDYDGAEPAASSVSLLNLLVLAHVTSDERVTRQIEATLEMFAVRAARAGRAVPMFLTALSTYYAGVPQIVLVGEPGEPERERLASIVRAQYLPSAVTIPVTSGNRQPLIRLLPWLDAMGPRGGRATAYVCREFSCLAPASSPDELTVQLASLAGEH